jgi:hypothetical protein
MPDSRATVSISPTAAAVAADVREHYHFSDIMDVVRFGAAVAMAHKISPVGGRTPGPATGTWNLGSLDRDSELRSVIQALYPGAGEDPAVMLETLMDRGLILLGQMVKQGEHETLAALVARVRGVQSAVVS